MLDSENTNDLITEIILRTVEESDFHAVSTDYDTLFSELEKAQATLDSFGINLMTSGSLFIYCSTLIVTISELRSNTLRGETKYTVGIQRG